jgi:hypothetical protein
VGAADAGAEVVEPADPPSAVPAPGLEHPAKRMQTTAVAAR